ncbi:MAG: radical SAM protein [Hadesarchaea archaeon]|nr:radical SAM protein [Hadesarchaea archaeon]
MHKAVKTRYGSLLLGEMPKGCKLCIKGAKLVLFVTGLCDRGCFYCPLSEKRRGKDVVYANERPVRSLKDIIEEAELIDALGTGLTGGDPAVRFERALRYLRLLKRKLGKRHHVHMYVGRQLSSKQLQKLRKAGLDELRFHTWSAEPVKLALDAGLNAGVEIPAIPGEFRKIITLLRELDRIGCPFINLNELEFSDTNLHAFKERGFDVKSDESMAVKGSEELARKVLEWARGTDLNVHYCPSALKDGVQLRNRLKRRAKNVAKPYDVITKDGLLVKGIAYELPLSKLAVVRRRLMREYDIPGDLIAIDHQKRRLEMAWYVAEELAKLEPNIKFALVEEYPTYDRLETTFVPLHR